MDQLKEEIHSYWSNRAGGYSEYSRQEMADERLYLWRKKVLSLINQKFGDKAFKDIKILDVGTGPGFFAIMLAKEGYSVTALDYTEDMINEARSNAGNLRDNISWYVGDAQNLEFKESAFDVVITRNVTWTLPDPEKAYKEWYRVLRKNGLFMNFDADWYGHLFDQEKRKQYLADRERAAEENVQDYYDIDSNDRMEQIAKEVPLSRKNRPAWDVDTMQKSGFSEIVCDENVWKEVWNEEEIINNSSTPIFLVSGTKSVENTDLKLCGIHVSPGEKWSGELLLSDGNTRLPASILNGKLSGETVLITAGVHAGEYVGIQTAVELAADFDVNKLAGSLVILKAVNRPAFENRAGSLGFTDHKNLNRVFPGKEDGSEMEHLAYQIEKDFFGIADRYIDLHSGDDFEDLTSYVYYAGAAQEDVVKYSREMAEQVDVPYMVKSNVSSGGSYNYAASSGIPSILIERGGRGLWEEEEIRSTRRDIRNILCHLGIYHEETDYHQYFPMEVTDLIYQDAAQSGLWYPQKKPGDLVKRGEILGYVKDYEQNILETVIAQNDGVILYQTVSLQVMGDSPMIAYGRINYKSDNRKQKIVNYWTKRSEGFLVQRRNELHSYMADRWISQIRQMLPTGQGLRILDVGCGAGFFSILLAKEGHQVTGIDLTPEMVENARLLAAEEKAECTFDIMDAEVPDFEKESFDVIVSRNLTWTLPHAEIAYKNWLSLLKKGGMILNFDANYGLDNFADTKGLPKNHAHHTLGTEMMAEAELIKKQLPISRYSRPAWDLETLGQLAVSEFQIDLGVGKRIYTEKDEFYNPTPVFMIKAVK